MRKELLYLLLLGIMLLSVACSEKTADSVQKYPYKMIDNTYMEYYGNNSNLELIKSYEQYKQYVVLVSDEHSDEDVIEKLKQYDEEFFDERMLVVIYHNDISGSYQFDVDNVTYEEYTVNVELKKITKEILDDAVSNYVILLELIQNQDIIYAKYSVSE